MNDDNRKALGSLFSSTSAFDAPWIPDPSELPAPQQSVVASPSEQLKKIASLIEEAMETTDDMVLLPLLEEALEVARRNA